MYVCNDPQRGPHRYQWAAVHRSSHIAKMGLTTALLEWKKVKKWVEKVGNWAQKLAVRGVQAKKHFFSLIINTKFEKFQVFFRFFLIIYQHEGVLYIGEDRRKTWKPQSRPHLQLAVRNSKRRWGNKLKKYERSRRKNCLSGSSNGSVPTPFCRKKIIKSCDDLRYPSSPPPLVRARLLQRFFKINGKWGRMTQNWQIEIGTKFYPRDKNCRIFMTSSMFKKSKILT
jgi:hypothetical protein